jgi:hypothetical protein
LEGHLPPVEGGLSPVTAPPEPPSHEAWGPNTKTEADEVSRENTDLGMSRDVPTDPETGVDEALKIAYRVVTGAYSKAPLKAPAPAKRP